MLDVKYVIDHLDEVIERLNTRNDDFSYLKALPELENKRKELILKTDTLKAERNAQSKNIGKLKAEHKDKEAQELLNKISFDKEEIARLNNAEKYYKKYLSTPFKSKKEYYKQGVEMYLRKLNGETIENFERVLNQYKESYIDRQKHIDQLYQEIKEIKKLKV